MTYKILMFLGISVVIYLGIAVTLVLSQSAKGRISLKGGLDFSRQIAGVVVPLPLEPVQMRDGYPLMTRYVSAQGKPGPLVVLVHGSGWHGQQFDGLAARLSDVADVLAPDLRGHGHDPERRGDVDYIGQLEDDLADLIEAYRKEDQKVVLVGHSSGGGLVVRFAGGDHGGMIDGAVLLAPFLKYNAPTTRANAGGWAQPLTRRIIGLSMLNNIGLHLLDDLTVIRFGMPDVVLNGPLGDTATTAYTWRMNVSFAPRGEYLKDVAALPEFLLVVGKADESFVANGYEPLLSPVTDKGRYVLLDGVSHLDVVNAPQTETEIRKMLDVLR